MRPTLKTALWSAVLTVAVASAACSGNGSSASLLAPTPAAPSAAAPPPASSVAGATIDGVVVSSAPGTGTRSTSALTASVAPLSTGGQYTITVSGTSITVVSGADGRFVLQNVPPGTITLQISGNGVLAQVTVADVELDERVRLTVRVNGGSAEIEDEEQVSDTRAEVEGRITAVNGNALTVGTRQVIVPAGTPIRHGGTARAFADLVPGVRVHIKATRAGEVFTAMEVNLQNDNLAPAPGSGGSSPSGGGEAEVSGAIVGPITGSCPAVSFTVGTTVVKTSASTKFDDVRCESLSNGDVVSVEGTKQADGSLLATELEKKGATGNRNGDREDDDGDRSEVELSGAVAGAISGACPAISFTVGTTLVKTNASTKFDGVTCGTLKSGDSVSLEGARQADGSILAREIEKKSASTSSGSSSKNGKR